MERISTIRGWKIHHQERLYFKGHAGTPILMVKFFQYPEYRQTVQIEKSPEHCKLKVRKKNSFFIYRHQVGTKGMISFNRFVNIFPHDSFINLDEDWGNISDFPLPLQMKYLQSSRFWPVNSVFLKEVCHESWFETDDLSDWVQSACRYVSSKIIHRENQERRLGAYDAFLRGLGDCEEFTDLFITFARMRGIPCRRLTGYFIRKNKRFIAEAHAWSEILSPKIGFIPIDVTLNNLGNHNLNYVILKIEEFNPSLPDYEISTVRSVSMHYHWERPDPIFTPIY
jgi:hypothetical protein